MAHSTDGRILKRANPTTIQDKFLVGYQGWFTCAGDGRPVHVGHHGWLHWFNKPIPDGGRPSFDSWPDVSAYTPPELFPAPGLTLSSGEPARLFSSRHPLTVQRHFHWMAEHGVDGAFLQRFAGQCEVDGRTDGGSADIMRLRDEVHDRVREAAEKEGRVWAIMYDVSGVPADRIEKVIRVDWGHLLRDKKVLESPYYLKEKGRPVIALWGFGFQGRGHTPDLVRNIVRNLRASTPGGAYIMAGSPTHWQTLAGDADPNPDFLPVWYNEFDAISPWTVGRYHDEESADRFARDKIAKDLAALDDPRNTKGRKVDYIPVVFPGASGHNLTQGRWGLNAQPRVGGRFLWRQLYNVRKAGARIVYGAMWDEYDEGTAFLPIASKKRELPKEETFLALDADGYDLPTDWYMRIAGFAGEILRGEKRLNEPFPVKDLQDYWSKRPRYEPAPAPSHSGPSSSSGAVVPSGSGANEDVTQSFDQWCEQEKEGGVDVPPPPYSLEASGEAFSASGSGTQRIQPQQPSVPVETRPELATTPADSRPPVPLASHPSSEVSSSFNVGQAPQLPSQPSMHNRPTSPLVSRPATLPSSSSSTSPPPRPPETPQGMKPGHGPGYIPGNIQQPNWNARSQQQQQQQQQQAYGRFSPHLSDINPRPSDSISRLDERFKQQTLADASTYSPGHGALSAHPSPSVPQWPPPEWGTMSSQPTYPQQISQTQSYSYPQPGQVPHPPPRSSGARPPPPPVHPATRPPALSPAPTPSSSSWTEPAYGGTGIGYFPEAETQPTASTYTNSLYGDGAGGFFTGHTSQPRLPYPGAASNPELGRGGGSTYPPQIPPRTTGMPSPHPSSSPPPPAGSSAEEDSSPGGFIPGQGAALNRLTSAATTARKRFEGSFGNLSGDTMRRVGEGVGSLSSASTKASADARKRVECGIGSLSSAGSKVYQRFLG